MHVEPPPEDANPFRFGGVPQSLWRPGPASKASQSVPDPKASQSVPTASTTSDPIVWPQGPSVTYGPEQRHCTLRGSAPASSPDGDYGVNSLHPGDAGGPVLEELPRTQGSGSHSRSATPKAHAHEVGPDTMEALPKKRRKTQDSDH